MPSHTRKRATPVPDEGGPRDTRPLSAREMTLVALAAIWVTFSMTVGYYVGEPYLNKGGDPQRPRAARPVETDPIASSAEGGFTSPSSLSEPNRAEMRLLRGEVARLRFWLLLAWIIQLVVVGAIVVYLVLRGRRFGLRLMHALAKLSNLTTPPDAQYRSEATSPIMPTDKPPPSWPPTTAESPPLSALTASLRRNREAIGRSRIEMENRSAADLTLRTL